MAADAYYHRAILRVGELSVLSPEFTRQLAPIAGFGNVLVHEYADVDWGEVYENRQRLADLARFGELVRHWLQQRYV